MSMMLRANSEPNAMYIACRSIKGVFVCGECDRVVHGFGVVFLVCLLLSAIRILEQNHLK